MLLKSVIKCSKLSIFSEPLFQVKMTSWGIGGVGLWVQCPGVCHYHGWEVAFFGRWVHGFFSMVAVGATNVGSIKVHFDQDLVTNTESHKNSTEMIYSEPIAFKKGEEFGYFNFGSTIVLIYEAPVDSSFNPEFTRRVKMGEGMYL